MLRLRVIASVYACLLMPVALIAQASGTPSSLTTEVPSLVVLSGTVQWVAGSTKDAGNVTLQVTADGGIEESWTLSNSRWGFKRSGFTGDGSCQTVNSAGTASDASDQRCLRTVPWFAPWLALKLVSDLNSAEADATTAADRTAGQQRLAFYTATPNVAALKPAALKQFSELKQRSALQLVYDVGTLTPVRMDFSDFPDSDPSRKIDTYVLYTDYRMEQGVMMPHHIQRFIQRTLQADLQITSVSTN